MKPVLAFAASLILTASPAAAHDFWVQPAHWHPEGGPLEVTLQVGHGPDRQRSPIRASRLVRLEAVHADGSIVDLHPDLHLGDAAGDFSARGSPAVLVLATDAKAESHLDAERFNSHLRGEGLSEAMAWRTAHQRSAAEGSENYGRVAKALLASTPAAVVQRPLGLELEIIPLADPYAAGATRLPVRVLFNGKPLPLATVKLYDLEDDASPKAVCLTDADGGCAFDFARRSSWLVNTVWSVPNPPEGSTDFRTIFSSLSFGFDR
jgi:uncharacterized GH25 family protein